ncbi:MAG: LamG domain-containing protein [Ignavibacteriae bacterium]|nr:LamG domain-containing protein [Ignavibacteria bacterium]MBI3364993.1 LamG domain-containing protein [Ignavibacteriota bacterium]
MKTIALSLVCWMLAGASICYAQTMRIHTHSGVNEFNLSDIDSITFFVSPMHDDSDITSGIVLHMTFDGNTLDVSGNGNNGKANNATYVPDKWGNPASAYRFNGLNNYIVVLNSPSLNPVNQLSVSMWLRVDSIQSNYMDIVVKGGPVVGYFENREYSIYSKQNVTTWYPQWKSAGDGSGMHELDSDHHSYSVGQWVFFTFIVDRVSHRMQIYADGVLTEEVEDSYSSFNVNSYPMIIGWSEENLSEHTPLRGTMDDLRIYSRALTPAQIQFLYSVHK